MPIIITYVDFFLQEKYMGHLSANIANLPFVSLTKIESDEKLLWSIRVTMKFSKHCLCNGKKLSFDKFLQKN